MVKYSIIIPVYNEEGSVIILCAEIKKIMDKIADNNYEIIFIDDGSTDDSLSNLKKILPDIQELVILSLNKNYGQSLALQAGIDIASGEIIITLDGDLQNDPKDIPQLLEKMDEGYDVVCGWQKDKYTQWPKAYASLIANYLRRIIFHEKIHDVGCMFRAYTKNSLKDILLDGCKHRFLTALLAKKGRRIGEVEIKSHPRLFGISKYGILDRTFSSILQMFRIFLSNNKSDSAKKYEIKRF